MTVVEPAVDDPSPTPPPRPKAGWKWLLVAVPMVVVAALIFITLVTHSLNEPSVADRTFLAPTSSAGLGGQVLLDRLRAKGVTVDVYGNLRDVPRAARTDPPSTVFIPQPSLEIDQLDALVNLPPGTRVVLVEPGNSALNAARLAMDQTSVRWATKVESPGCGMAEAVSAGPAAVRHAQYVVNEGPVISDCYNHALVQIRWRELDVVVVGTADIFRNDRINEYGNSALAVNLLTATGGPVLWIDGHQATAAAVQQPAGGSTVGGPNEEEPESEPEPAIYPSWLWPLLVALGLAFIVFAAGRGRRLGAPVAEPLPVLVSNAETVRGRGHLYRRIHARDKALNALREGVRTRLRSALHLPADTPPETLVAAVAGPAGLPPDTVFALLYAGPVGDDAALTHYVAGLDGIERAVTHAPARPTGIGADKGEPW